MGADAGARHPLHLVDCDSSPAGCPVSKIRPIFEKQGEVGVAEAERRQQENVYADTAVHIRASARSAATQLDAARARLIYSRDVILPLKQKVVEETQLQYNAMLVGVFQLLQAKREQIEAGARYIDQLREYWIARTNVEELLAGRLDERALLLARLND
jgi:cobalt-zinc-cadmium efflux system outer membrane protein